MCGIIGITGFQSIVFDLVSVLENLEYRGYDSAGIATVDMSTLHVCKAVGNLDQLKSSLDSHTPAITGEIGIGHTRWATHGAPKLENAHPIATHKVAVVHNGIIENYQKLKDELTTLGTQFQSDTDTEVIAHLITVGIENGLDIFEACRMAALKLEGSFAVAVISKEFPDTLIGFKHKMPLLVGIGNKENTLYIASDAIAISQFANSVVYLDDQQIAEIKLDGNFKINDLSGSHVKYALHNIERCNTLNKGDFHTFMKKEIYEQCNVLKDILSSYQGSNIYWRNVNKICILACGSSNYAGYTAKYFIEGNCDIAVEVDIASEFATRKPKIYDDTLYLFISQSGETADTVTALNYVKQFNAKTACITSVAYSTLGRSSNHVIEMKAGPEIAVAATKTFTAQLLILLLLSFEIKNKSSQEKLARELQLFNTALINEIEINIEKIAHLISNYDRFLYIGRGTMYPICLEGALKMRELSYASAIGIAAGELKHGSIALVDSKTLIIALVPHDETYVKMASAVQEVNARSGDILLISDQYSFKNLAKFCKYNILLQDIDNFLKPILYSLPLQLIAYHVAIARGCNVDKPRNLAKSVTVE